MGHTPYYDKDAAATLSTSRLECAKQALQVWISDLMIQSKQHEVAVVVCKTKDTIHQLNEEHFPNLTVLPLLLDDNSGAGEDEEKVLVGNSSDDDDSNIDTTTATATTTTTTTSPQNSSSLGITRPTISLLQQVEGVKCTERTLNSNRRGDVMDGLVIATDAMNRRTLGKKYSRSVVLLTDACHRVAIDSEEQQQVLLQVVDSLRNMDCQLHVIGLDFKTSAVFDAALPESEAAASVKEDDDSSNDGSETDDEENQGGVSSSDDDTTVSDDNTTTTAARDDTERFLISIARLTGGSVRAASSLHQVLKQQLGKRIPTSTRRKVLLQLLGSTERMEPLHVRVSLLLSKTNLPTLKKEAMLLDEQTAAPLKDGMGNFMTSELETATDHFDAIHKDLSVDETARTKAVKYGSDWIPLNDFDVQGLKERSDVCITILGYTAISNIDRGYRMGPPYGVAGADDSKRARAAVSALAQALHRLQSCAIGTYVKSKHADPILVALFPLETDEGSTVTTANEDDPVLVTESSPQAAPPQHLALLQLPYCGDVQKMVCAPLDAYCTAEPKKQQRCDDLIDSMMLEPNQLNSTAIPNPAIRSFRKTLVQRAIATNDPIARNDPLIVNARGEWFTVPFLETAQPAMEAFRKTFPIIKGVKNKN
jgi:hypothetical protein